MCEWKEQDPYCHVDSVTLLSHATFYSGNIRYQRARGATVVLRKKDPFRSIGLLCLDFTFHV